MDPVDKELFRVRLRFIDLIKSFFISEPDAEKMSRWRGIFTSLDGEQINPIFDAAVVECKDLLSSQSLKELQDEYYDLFEDPFNKKLIPMSASFYIDGRTHAQTLADFRGFLMAAGLEKEDEVIEAEDSLVVMLDTLARLIEGEENGEESSRASQSTLISEFLGQLADNVYERLEADERAKFYASCGKFLKGYLDLERCLMMEIQN